MRQFWHSDIIEKSFRFLIELNREFNFILIGGWAVYFWSRKMKSRDIDIVVDFLELGKIRKRYSLIRNSRLRKYEIKFREFDVDIYLPYYSKIGFPLNRLSDYIQNIEGFNVPKVEVLLLMKLFVFSNRKGSVKGEKDKIDIIGLLDSVEIDWLEFKRLCRKYNSSLIDVLRKVLQETKQVSELGISVQRVAEIRRNTLKKLDYD